MAGIDLSRRVYRTINGGEEHLDLMTEALRVRSLPAPGPAEWWRDRLRFIRSAVNAGLRVSRHDAPYLASSSVAYFPGSRQAQNRAARIFFLEHHFGEMADCLGQAAFRRPRLRQSNAWLAWWLRGIWWSLLGLFDWSERRYAWLAGALSDILLFKRLHRELRHVYVFAMYDRRQYLLLTFLARHTSLEATVVYQGMPLARNCRHLHLQVPVVLTSRVNLIEVDYYRQKGEFLSTNVSYASQYNILDLHGLRPHDPTYDIGYYSSGEWARRDGLYQAADVARVQAGEFQDNAYARAAAEQLEALTAYVLHERRTLRIFPHPFERRLMQDHDVVLPYAALADGVTVTIDTNGGNSRRSMYDVRVAVSLQSSFIWERLDLGLEASYMHEFADPEMNVFEKAALGRYAVNVCPTTDDLIAKVSRALQQT